VDGFLLPHRYLIMDRDPVFTQAFRARLARAGIEPIRLPRRSPNPNAFIERFNRSIKLVREYVAYYHEERPPHGLSSINQLAPRLFRHAVYWSYYRPLEARISTEKK